MKDVTTFVVKEKKNKQKKPWIICAETPPKLNLNSQTQFSLFISCNGFLICNVTDIQVSRKFGNGFFISIYGIEMLKISAVSHCA